MEFGDKEFEGEKLLDLVCAIEMAIGSRAAGCTPLGIAVTSLCEDAVKKGKDEESKSNQQHAVMSAARE